MKWRKDDLLKALALELPGIVAHDIVLSYARPSVKDILQSDTDPRMSAVVFLLYPKRDDWYFLLLKRHDYKGVHSGQVGLPGGSLDEGEGAEEAAIRELFEESGLEIERAAIAKPLTSLYIPPSNFIVQPYAAIIEYEPKWEFDSYEVKRGIEVPLVHLLKEESLVDTNVTVNGGATRLKVKAFNFEEEVVWGATAMILSECKEILRTLAT
jgi:8-oxo-dGTP pyrophosphatase MutT (NUDIX family)